MSDETTGELLDLRHDRFAPIIAILRARDDERAVSFPIAILGGWEIGVSVDELREALVDLAMDARSVPGYARAPSLPRLTFELAAARWADKGIAGLTGIAGLSGFPAVVISAADALALLRTAPGPDGLLGMAGARSESEAIEMLARAVAGVMGRMRAIDLIYSDRGPESAEPKPVELRVRGGVIPL